MLFNSFEFGLFLFIISVLYYTMHTRYRVLLLLLASYFFYSLWHPLYGLILLCSTCIDYYCAIKMDEKPLGKERKLYWYLSLGTNLSLLFFFKYLYFFSQTWNQISSNPWQLPLYKIVLPVGISFYTFQILTYSYGVYKGRIKAEKRWDVFALFVVFFPQLVAGPIERAEKLLPQLKQEVSFDYDRIVRGLRLAFWGLCKKMLIADRLALVVDEVYGNVDLYGDSSKALATLLFHFQIYCDFSAYSDMAIGIACIYGVRLQKNFDKPFLAYSFTNFWQRWHISLSNFFRDYIYIPLGGNKRGLLYTYRNVFLIFLISGIWHGANWTFIAWGGVHAIFYVIGNLVSRYYSSLSLSSLTQRIFQLCSWLVVFLGTAWAWIFYRAESIGDAWQIASDVLWLEEDIEWNKLLQNPHISKNGILLSVVWIVLLFFGELIDNYINFSQRFKDLSTWQRWLIYYIAAICLFSLGIFDSQAFIYFQF